MKSILSTATLFFILISLLAQAQEIVTTKSGRTVILYSNHTWQYYEIQKKQSEPQKQSIPKKPIVQGNKVKRKTQASQLLLANK